MKINSKREKSEAYKIVFIGSYAVGKTSLINRFTRNEFRNCEQTVGADFVLYTVELMDERNNTTDEIHLYIWDTAGQERYKSLLPMYYKNASAIVITFDLTKKDSFLESKTFVKSITEMAKEMSKPPIVILCGNKCDLKENRLVSVEEAAKIVQSFNLLYIETSAKTNENIDNLFYKLAVECHQRNVEKVKNHGLTLLETIPRKEGCCFNSNS